jgi:diguanylate cyclase (GGDEF)-like protein/PAS domain S-box-containing protein
MHLAPEGAWQLLVAASSLIAGLAAFAHLEVRRNARSERRRLEGALGERELLLESIEVTPTPFALYDKNDRLIAWNKSYQDIHGPGFIKLTQPIYYADLMRAALSETLPSEALEAAVAERVAAQARADGSQHDRQYGSGRWFRISKQRTRSGAIAGFASDITELKHREAELAESEARYRALAETSPTGIWRIDEAGRPLYANSALLGLLGFAGDTPTDNDELRRRLDEVSTAMLAERRSGQARGRFETRLRTMQGDERHVLVVTTDWLPSKDATQSCLATIVDIHELKLAQARIEHLATHDLLTGLGNRVRFERSLDEAIATAHLDRTPVTLLAIDLDHFKEVNDRYGHLGGDATLRQAAERMRAATRRVDLAYRLGGDEFAIILPKAMPAMAQACAERLLAAFLMPFDLDGRQVQLGASIGIANFPDDSASAEELLRHADIALYRMKRRGRGGIAPFAEDIAQDTQSRRRIEA